MEVLFTTATEIGFADAPEIKLLFGIDVAEIEMTPRREGLQEQETVKLDPDPVAGLETHPGIGFPPALNVTFDATVTLASI